MEDLISCLPVPAKDVTKKIGRLFRVVHGGEEHKNGYKLKLERFNLHTRKNFFTMRTVRQRNRLPRDVVQAPSMEIFKT